MTPAKLKCFQDKFKEMEENKSDFFNSILPNQLTLKQHNLLKTFVTERIQINSVSNKVVLKQPVD